MTQDRVVRLFRDTLGYTDLGDYHEREGNSNIEEAYLRAFLARQGYTPEPIDRALYELRRAADDQSKSLYDCNKAVYGLLRYGVRAKADVGDTFETVWGAFALKETFQVPGGDGDGVHAVSAEDPEDVVHNGFAVPYMPKGSEPPVESFAGPVVQVVEELPLEFLLKRS